MPTAVRRFILLLVIVPVIVTLAVAAFTWASADPDPHDLPIGASGPPGAIEAIEGKLATHPDAFDLHEYASAGEAREAIENREIYGAHVQSESGPQLLTASAASSAVTQILTTTLASPDAGGTPPAVVDVVPADSDDPRGSALGSLVLPLVLVSVITAVIVLLVARPGWEQVGMIASAALVGALVAVAIAQGGFGVLQGNWALNVVAPALTIAAIAATIVGLTSAFGRIGLVAVAPLMIFLGNPWSGAMSSPHLLPEPAGLIGQLLPPGAGSTALRSLSFFDGAGSGTPILVLSLWIALGVGGICIGAMRRRDVNREMADTVRPLVKSMER